MNTIKLRKEECAGMREDDSTVVRKNKKMIFLSVPRSKYKGVTLKRMLRMIKDVIEIYGEKGVEVTMYISDLKKCDFAYFRPDYKKYILCERDYDLCKEYKIPIIVGRKIVYE